MAKLLQSSKLGNRFKKINPDNVSDEKRVSESVSTESFEQKVDSSVSVTAGINFNDIENRYKSLLLAKIDSIPVWFEYSQEQQKDLISTFIVNKLSEENILFSDSDKNSLVENITSSILGFGPIDYLVKQENVDAIFINASSSVFIEISGKILNTEMKLTKKQLDFVVKHIKNISELLPPSDGDLIWNCKAGNLFITVVLYPVSGNGANIIIRKLKSCSSDKSLIEKGFCSQDIFDFIVCALNSRKNIIVSGDVSVGKTFFIDSLVKLALSNKRGAILQDYPQMLVDSDTLMKFYFSSIKNSYEYQNLFSSLMKLQPDFTVVDSNNPYIFNASVYSIYSGIGSILSARASSVETAISKFVNAISCEDNCTEKAAKLKFLTNFDYVIHIEKCADGVRRITSLIELTPAKTLAASFKFIAKWLDNHYELNIPQPLTSIKADELFKNGNGTSMRERFTSDIVAD